MTVELQDCVSYRMFALKKKKYGGQANRFAGDHANYSLFFTRKRFAPKPGEASAPLQRVQEAALALGDTGVAQQGPIHCPRELR